MRIAIVSTPFIRVPPSGYGGTELFCHELAEGLSARGHEVTLFATGDSVVSCRRRSLYGSPSWPPVAEDEVNHVAWAFSEIAREDGFDVIRVNSPIAVPFTRFVRVPAVHPAPRALRRELAHLRAPPGDRVRGHQRGSAQPGDPACRARASSITASRRRVIRRARATRATSRTWAVTPRRRRGPTWRLTSRGAAGLPIKLAGRAHPKDQI